MTDELVGAILVRQEVRKLTEKLDELSKQNSVLQRRLLWLTVVTTALAFIQTIVVLIQIFS
ncbi:MAG: hypothetical protein A2747_00720 [Candidatus Yonathbacteria bacterium RIFCSPHIGHO2_01_FULL_44_41]|uniref:Uncharacterized protein n=1 Tax=Candidatus Yonathbacteria bacterium RIFCSPHIGHO2_02_FULL_44_14 TaxID=1802724 RepID=A0A1G2S9E9_9BACT|nr:MAG: hypothetical protein A2747_00720 [Candidatus Yonathbacteria bacterium RIFCSPHIGHO2_01_FULL_44_41]OHA81381.1 MAG: hypothetical protein A3B06_02805 [Candidatus Yonathbacteria bacterium RIFCSPLOWO2_01_FULL_43_20]OHA81704.1 MAG: hypothetical protein A3D51_03910 [Candidatus Yonathbacteria bacterium RIFCSPHIGHO2_02_FULL_44_14]